MLARRTRPRVAQALVEFALVMPCIVALSLGVLQVMLYLHARDVVTSSAQEAARLSAEDGRGLEEGYARARTLIFAGLGSSLNPVVIDGNIGPDLVEVRVDAQLQAILPIGSLPVHAQAWVARERFRPGGL